MLGRRRRWRTNIKTTLGQCLVNMHMCFYRPILYFSILLNTYYSIVILQAASIHTENNNILIFRNLIVKIEKISIFFRKTISAICSMQLEIK